MNGLFDNDEAYQQAVVKPKRKLLRNLSGRFCTEEERRMEMLEKENRILKGKAEMYMRNWFAESGRASRKDRENRELKNKLEICLKELKKYRKKAKKNGKEKTERPQKR